MKDNKKTKFSLNSFLRNNRVIMILSLLIAFGIWMWVAIEKSPEVQVVISGVPVNINLENSIPQQLDLQIFGKSDFTVDVAVKGKKYIVSTLTADNISVEANTNYVDSPGTKTLQLKVTPKKSSDDFSIVSTSSNYIEVFFDKYKEIELPVVGKLETNLKQLVPEGYLLGDVVCSQQSVTVSGPATEINRITEVNATASTDNLIEKTTTFEPSIRLVTNDDTKLEYAKIVTADDITMTVPVLKTVNLPTSIEFKNAPSYYISNPLPYTISPSSVNIAIPVEMIESTKSYVVDTIDFSEIINSGNNSYRVDLNDSPNYKLQDPNVKNFKIIVNASGLDSKTVTVPASNISVKNNRDDFDVLLNTDKSISINLVGNTEELESLDINSVRIEVDTTDKQIKEDTQYITGKVILPSESSCWAVGKYDVKVKVNKK